MQLEYVVIGFQIFVLLLFETFWPNEFEDYHPL